MTALACVATENGSPTEHYVDVMLSMLKHRGTSRKTRCIRSDNSKFTTSIGCASDLAITQQFRENGNATVALDGTLYHARSNHAAYLQNIMRNNVAPMSQPGAYSAICYLGKRLLVIRDINGLKPLYYAQREGLIALASERKALWAIGLNDTDRILPGSIYTSLPRLSIKRSVRFNCPPEREMTIDEAASQLTRLLTRSMRLITRHLDSIAVAFSGGLDSAITAVLAKRLQKRVELISVGLTGSSELQTVEKYARQLDLPITIETFSPGSLEEYVRRVVWLIEDSNLMKVSVALPLHWAAMLAKKREHTVMLCGQGSDELYGGYYKYARILDEQGRGALRDSLYRSVLDASLVNYERDDQATSPSGVMLRTPFADPELIRFSLTIPSQYKVKAGNDVVRKWVLRTSAKRLHLPEEMIWRRKKAIQHGTGVENQIRHLAKKEGVTISDYLTGIYTQVARDRLMP